METTHQPQVRTLLLTDLVDSTQLVERIGDAAAAALFRSHDRIVLELQQRWRGRLIDRSDGLLLIFERPIDGLGFALDYARSLRDLGCEQGLKQTLQVRAGLHVGEVLQWENSRDAIALGAKQVEVEGLAKPLAGRLMALARPGQILLSATAEPLAHRAARELGERGETLVWKSYGRWRFKGLPEAQEVFEVGEPGLAPLRMPSHTPKAWRDLPLWRRPVALAAEALMAAGLAFGVWFLMHPQPAIAFAERDWVMVGDLRNLTGDPRLDESLEQAFRISLEQSRYVNVLSDLKVRETLGNMQRKPDVAVDRELGSEIAQRDGARALLLPTVAEVGGRLRVSAEVIDPRTQTTVYAVMADGRGADSVLGSIDNVTSQLREKLGEALQNVQKTSVPLPNVSTPNLDALKAYALGRSHYANDPKMALQYYQRALQLDPRFALARLEAGNVYAAKFGDFPAARREYAAAALLRTHLTPREALHLDASLARLGPPGPATQRWQQLVELYPDQLRARSILGQMALFDMNRADLALVNARAASVLQYEGRGSALYLQGAALLAQQRYTEALAQFDAARRAGFAGAVYFHAFAYAAQRDWVGMRRVKALRRPSDNPVTEIEVPLRDAVFTLDQGDWAEALRLAQEAAVTSEKLEPVYFGPESRIRLYQIELLAGTRTQMQLGGLLGNAVRDAAAQMQQATNDTDRINLANQLQALGYLAARNGTQAPLQQAISSVAAWPAYTGYPLTVQIQDVLRAELERLQGRPADAVRRLNLLAAKPDASIAVHSALLRALQASDEGAGVITQAHWLATHRGAAYMDPSVSGFLQPLSVADTTLAHLDAAEVHMLRKESHKATQEREAFLRAWPQAQLPQPIKDRLARITP